MRIACLHICWVLKKKKFSFSKWRRVVFVFAAANSEIRLVLTFTKLHKTWDSLGEGMLIFSTFSANSVIRGNVLQDRMSTSVRLQDGQCISKFSSNLQCRFSMRTISSCFCISVWARGTVDVNMPSQIFVRSFVNNFCWSLTKEMNEKNTDENNGEMAVRKD